MPVRILIVVDLPAPTVFLGVMNVFCNPLTFLLCKNKGLGINPSPFGQIETEVKSFINQLSVSPFFKVVSLDLNNDFITVCVFDMLGEGEIPFYKYRNSYAGVSDLLNLIVKCEAVAVEPIGRLHEEFHYRATNEGLPVIVVDLFAARLAVRLPQ